MKLRQAQVHIQKLHDNRYQLIVTPSTGGVYSSGELTLGEVFEILIDIDRGTKGDNPARYIERARP